MFMYFLPFVGNWIVWGDHFQMTHRHVSPSFSPDLSSFLGHVEGPEHSKQQHVPKEERKLAPQLQFRSVPRIDRFWLFFETLLRMGESEPIFFRCLEVVFFKYGQGPPGIGWTIIWYISTWITCVSYSEYRISRRATNWKSGHRLQQCS